MWVKQGVPCTNNGSNYVIIRASKALTLLFQSNPSYTGSMKRDTNYIKNILSQPDCKHEQATII